MSINFERALGIHPQALMLREKRSEILATNLANADTPDFKARDLDFKTILQKSLSSSSDSLQRTQDRHLSPSNALLGGELLYRNPTQPSLDGNTVEEHAEQAKYAQNAVQYQASLEFINSDFSGLMTAIRGA